MLGISVPARGHLGITVGALHFRILFYALILPGYPRVGHQRAPRVEAEGGGLRVQLLRGVPAAGVRGEAQIAQDSACGHV